MTRRYLILAALGLLIGIDSVLRDRYEKVIAVHVDVLGGMADKALGLASLSERPSPNDLTELLYPLERARQFLGEYSDDAGRPSYTHFAASVDAYQAMIDGIDAERGSARSWSEFRPNVAGQVALVQRNLAMVRAEMVQAGLDD